MTTTRYDPSVPAIGERVRTTAGPLDRMMLTGMCVALIAMPVAKAFEGIPIAILVLSLAPALFFRRLRLDAFSTTILLIGLIYLPLSYFDVFVNSWSPERSTEWIARQAHYVILFPLLACTIRLYLSDLPLHWRHFPRPLVLAILVGVAVLTFNRAMVSEGLSPYGLSNTYALGYVLAFVALYRWPLLFSVLMVALAATAASEQNLLLALLLIFIRLIRPGRLTICTILIAPVCMILFIPLAAVIHQVDPNSGVRLGFLLDALVALKDSKGFGIGFGTWGISNYFDFLGLYFTDTERSGFNIFTISTHNSIYGVAQRLGWIVIVAYVIAGWRVASAASPLHVDERRIVTAVALVFATAIGVNVGIESPTYSVGSAALWAFLHVYSTSAAFRELFRRPE